MGYPNPYVTEGAALGTGGKESLYFCSASSLPLPQPGSQESITRRLVFPVGNTDIFPRFQQFYNVEEKVAKRQL